MLGKGFSGPNSGKSSDQKENEGPKIILVRKNQFDVTAGF